MCGVVVCGVVWCGVCCGVLCSVVLCGNSSGSVSVFCVWGCLKCGMYGVCGCGFVEPSRLRCVWVCVFVLWYLLGFRECVRICAFGCVVWNEVVCDGVCICGWCDVCVVVCGVLCTLAAVRACLWCGVCVVLCCAYGAVWYGVVWCCVAPRIPCMLGSLWFCVCVCAHALDGVFVYTCS